MWVAGGESMQSDRRQAFERDGWIFCPGLFTGREAADLLAAIQAAQPREPGENELSTGAMTFASNLFYDSVVLRELAGDDRLIELACDLAGPDLWVRWDQAVRKGPGAPEFPWHQDNGYTQLAAEHLQVWLALTPMRPENGGLWLSPGTHHTALPHTWVGPHAQHLSRPANPTPIMAEPGDVVVFSSFLLHATSPNTTTEDRWAYVLEYLPLEHGDPSIPSPHLVVARHGESCIEFIDDPVGADPSA
jgi:hypothetical protein